MIPLRDDNPTTIRPIVTMTIIVVATLVFLWQLSLGEKGFEAAVLGLGVIPATLLGGEPLPPPLYLVPPVVRLFTSMFMHGACCTSASTCCISGSSATTSRTPWGTCVSSCSIC